MSTKWQVKKYADAEVEEFQRKVIDLAQNIRFDINDEEELMKIANALETIAYNDNLAWVKEMHPNFPNGF